MWYAKQFQTKGVIAAEEVVTPRDRGGRVTTENSPSRRSCEEIPEIANEKSSNSSDSMGQTARKEFYK